MKIINEGDRRSSFLYSVFDIIFRIYLILTKQNTIYKRTVIVLEKFVARKPEKEVISMRISTDVLKTVDDKAAEIGISRNELLNQMIQYALDNMGDTQK